MLEQVLLNLTRNAFEAMEHTLPGEKVVEIETRQSPHTGVVSIEICDRGRGVSPDIAAQLFQPFVTDKADGLGIGLSLCRSVIEAHGGSLRHFPRPGGGAIFRVELPVFDAAPPLPAA
jgi:signal transduction histidine kinase